MDPEIADLLSRVPADQPTREKAWEMLADYRRRCLLANAMPDATEAERRAAIAGHLETFRADLRALVGPG